MEILRFSSSATLAPRFTHSTKPHKFFLSHNQLILTRAKVGATTETASVGGELEAAATEEPPSIDFAFVNSRLLPDGSPDIQIRSAPGGQKLRDIMLDANIDLYGPYDGPLLNCAGGGTCRTCMVEIRNSKICEGRRDPRIVELDLVPLTHQPVALPFKFLSNTSDGFPRGGVILVHLVVPKIDVSEVIEGKELLNPRTDKEKELLKKKPKTWRLACQTTVGKSDSRGQVYIQQLPEWKAHEWKAKNYKGEYV